MITASAPLPTRVWAYLLERFPPVAYTVLVGLFAASAFSLAARQAGTVVGLEDMSKSAAVVLLVFLHLRLMDEHKDHEADEKAYPERCLSRGVVTLPLLFRLGVIAVVIEALLAFSLSSAAAIAWSACLIFTLLMRLMKYQNLDLAQTSSTAQTFMRYREGLGSLSVGKWRPTTWY